MSLTPSKIYRKKIESGEIRADSTQEKALQELQRAFDEIMEAECAPKLNFLQKMAGFKQKPAPLGVYMYGGVGRGKSMLMDLFYDSLPAEIKKRRVHFHEFMIEVHNYINTRSDDGSVVGSVDQALPSLAEIIARKSHVLCFDEFHVVDITDAMILGRLFKILFEHDVVIVTTGNWAVDDLYKDGLQRERFLPFIELLKAKVALVHLDSPHDYRMQTTKIEGTYFTPLGRKTKNIMNDIFEKLIEGAVPKSDILQVKGRNIEVKESANGVARFSFAQLCERPHGAEDYIEIARKYHTVFLEDIPRLSYDMRNEAKRLMNLIDALYEARTRVIISAQTSIDKLYRVGDHAYEFERTASRLMEMQSDGWVKHQSDTIDALECSK